MTSEAVTRLVEAEIAGNWGRSNLHGVNLKDFLVPPKLRQYTDGFQPENQMSLWLVLEEDPVNKSGYKIIFDEQSGLFGLAVCGIEWDVRDVFIGYHGRFLDTLKGM